MKIYLTDTSRHPDNAVRWLVNFAAREVYAVAKHEGWSDRFDNLATSIRVTHTASAYRGRYLGSYRAWAIKGFNPRLHNVAPDTCLRNVLTRIGEAKHYPLNETYWRFKDMPEITIADWQEATVLLVAHELAHTRYSGRREGEFNCELVAHDAVDAFRLRRAEFEKHLLDSAQADAERETALAAKQSPDAVFAKRLAVTTAAMTRWARKLKLAETKFKKYARALRRLQAKQPQP